MAKQIKGAPTELNISVLAELVADHGGTWTFANRISNGPSVAHLRRCVKSGWLVVNADGTLTVAEVARPIVLERMKLECIRWSKRGFGNGSTEEMYKAQWKRMDLAFEKLGGKF